MPLTPVDPREFGNKSPGHRGRVGYPLLKEFMESVNPETGEPVLAAAIDMTGMQQTLQTLRATLSYHINKGLPVGILQRNNTLYLYRRDKEMLEDGTVVDVEDWETNEPDKPQAKDEPTPIDMDELNRRYDEEKNAVTK